MIYKTLGPRLGQFLFKKFSGPFEDVKFKDKCKLVVYLCVLLIPQLMVSRQVYTNFFTQDELPSELFEKGLLVKHEEAIKAENVPVLLFLSVVAAIVIGVTIVKKKAKRVKIEGKTKAERLL